MVQTVGSIQVLFQVNHSQYERNVMGMANTTVKSGDRMAGAVRRTDHATQSLNRTMARMRGREFRVLSLAAMRTSNSVERLKNTLIATTALFGGFTAAFGIKALMDYSDAYKEVGNRLRVVKKEATDLASIEQKIFETAQKSRAEYKSTGILYARLANSARRLQIAQKDVLRVTETIQKSFIVGGSTGVEATQSAVQLSQGIASNRLQGDELRSVLENPALGQLLADEITGGNIGKLREIAAEGKLTAGVLIRAFKAASGEIDRLFAETQETIGQSFIKLDNAMMRYIGTSETAQKSSRATVTAINAIVDNFDTVGDSIANIGIAIAGLMGARFLGGLGSSFILAGKGAAVYRQETRAAASATYALSVAEAQTAKKNLIQQRLAYNAALRDGNYTTKQMTGFQNRHTAALGVYRGAVNNVIASQHAHNAAFKGTTLGAGAASVAMRGLSASMAFLGGPIGAALLAIGGAFWLISKNAAAAAEQTEKYAQAARDVAAIRDKLRKDGGFIDADHQNVALAKTVENLDGIQAKMNGIVDAMFKGQGIDGYFKRTGIKSLILDLKEGNKTLEEFLSELDTIKGDNPDAILSGQIISLKTFIHQLLQAKDGIEEVAKAATSLDDIQINMELTIDQKELLNKDLHKQIKSELEKAIREGKPIGAMDRRMYGHLIGDKVKPYKGKLSDKEKAARRSDRSFKSETEKYIQGMEKLRNSGAEMFMDEFDQKVVQSARSLGLAEEEITRFVTAVRSGSDIPSQFSLIRDEIDKIAANENLIRMADGLSQGLGDLFTGLADGSKTAGEAFLDFGKKIQSLVLQILVIEPLVRSLRSAMLGGVSSGSSDLWAGMRAPTAHAGWTVGKGSAPGSRVVSPSVFNNAPKFHGGLRNNEIAAILENDETVLTKSQSQETANRLSGMKQGGGNTYVNIVNESGGQVQEQRRHSGGDEFVDIVIGAVNQGISQGKLNKTMGGQYGARPRKKER